MRVKITLRCNDTVDDDADRIELKKYCRFCKKQTVHSETK